MNNIAVSKEADSLYHKSTDKAALSKTADSLYQKRKYLEALFIYQRLLRIDSNDGLFYFRSGYCEGMSFLYVEAIKDFKSALNHNYRKKASCYFNLSADYASIDSESMSIYYARKCIEADSTMKPKIIELLKHNNYKLSK